MLKIDRYKKLLITTLLGICLVGDPRVASAAPSGSVKLPSSKLFQTTVKGKTYTCGNLPPWSPGRIVSGKFYPTKTELAATKAQARKAASKTRKTLEAKVKSLTATLNAGKNVCKAGKPGTSPTPPPDSGNAYFDSSGRVTSAGKSAFGIPSSFNASVGAGISAWKSNCSGCHGSSVGAIRTTNFGSIKSRVQLSPMSFSIPSELTEQQIADITAYANY